MILHSFTGLLLGASIFSFSAAAQKKKPTPRPASAPMAKVAEMKTGIQKASNQLKNLTKFVFLLGGIASGIEDADSLIKSGKASRTLIDQNSQNKQRVIANLSALRAGLADLEIEFRTKTSLRPYLLYIDGISGLAAESEQQASEGRLTDAGKTLLIVAERLTDALAALP